jgi:probable F420-dependent oxidoreductase
MKLGVVFPQTEVNSNPQTVTEFVQAVEDCGYDFLLAYDHVLGANPNDPTFDGPYDNEDLFHEPLTLFAYLASITETLVFGTSILILPQRQTALVAKQAAEVDVLSGGRLRLGVGIGWNELEYEVLGMDFNTRGQRIEEQVDVLRRLWTDHLVEFGGRWHHLPDVGINPRPVQRPIPLWMGGDADPALQRVGRLADGWVPRRNPKGDVEDQLATIRSHARETDRDLDEFQIIARVQPDGDPSEWLECARKWHDFGATHLAVDAVGMELSFEEHTEVMTAFYKTLTDAGLGDN